MAFRTVHTMRGNVARPFGEKYEIPGSGIVVLGRAPIYGTITFDDADTASAIPLSRGLRISQEFASFTISHPYAEGGSFQFVVLQGDDWYEEIEAPEAIGWTALNGYVSGLVGATPVAQLRNSATPLYKGSKLRLVRVNRVILISRGTGAELDASPPTSPSFAGEFWVGVGPGFVPRTPTGTLNLNPTDTRHPLGFPDSRSSQCDVEYDTDIGNTPGASTGATIMKITAGPGQVYPIIRECKGVVLVPGAGMAVFRLPSIGMPDAQMQWEVNWELTEEPFN